MSHPLGLRPSKIIAVHLNYRSRAEQRGRTPDAPSYFLKPPSSLSHTGAPVVRPKGCELLTFEGEIAMVLGTRAHRVTPEEALTHVAYFTAANDFGLYDMRHADRGSNLRSKGIDGYTPVGPALLPAGAVDPSALTVRTWVNGRLAQQAGINDLIFDLGYLIADLSRLVTLEPGDIVLAGTPAGSHPVRPGDIVEVEVAGSGRLRNDIVDDDGELPPVGAMPRVTAADRAAAEGSPLARLDAATERALRGVSTATLASQLRARGLDNVFFQGVTPVRPGTRMVGAARTLRYGALREDVFARLGTGFNAQKRAIEALHPGEILVIEARGDAGAGTVGDILCLRASRRGAAGVVTDGGLRDSPAVRGMDLPVYSGAPHAAVLGRRHVPLDADLPITCGGVLVMPGDVLVGDDEGVVVVPLDLVDEVARDAAEQEWQERFITERVAAGAGLAGLYPLGTERRAEYEVWRARQAAGHEEDA